MKIHCILFEIHTVNPPLQTRLTEEEIIQLAETENYYVVMIDNPISPQMATVDGNFVSLNRVGFSNAGGIVTVR